MTKLFGIDLAKVAAKALGPGLLKMKLIKLTVGSRTDGALDAGTNPASKSYACKGVTTDFSLSQFDGELVQKGDRKVLLLGGTLPAGVFPVIGDHVVAEGVESEVVNVSRDPASASYECHCRGA